MRVGHFFHIYAAGEGWEDAVADHVEALERGGWEDPVQVGLVGEAKNRNTALSMVPRAVVSSERQEGWENVTIDMVRDAARSDAYEAIMYTHTKGAANPTQLNIAWRRSMERHVVERWRENAELLLRDHDAVGCHWVSPHDYPHYAHITGPVGFFGGNYWIATTEYLRRLPECPRTDRWEAERWIASERPRVYDLLEGWPSFEAFERGRL